MPIHISFFWYKINQKIVIVFRFAIKIIVQNVQITKRNESTQIGDGWRNAVDEPKIQHVCPYWRPPSSLAVFRSSSLPPSVSLFLLPFPHDATPLQSDCGEASPPYWPSFVGKLPLTDVCIVEPTTLLFGWVLGANTRTHGWHLRYITAVPLGELSRVYPSWVKNYR